MKSINRLGFVFVDIDDDFVVVVVVIVVVVVGILLRWRLVWSSIVSLTQMEAVKITASPQNLVKRRRQRRRRRRC